MNFEIVATPFFIRELKRLAKRYPAIRTEKRFHQMSS